MKRVILPYGGIAKVSAATGLSRDTVSDYLAGHFDSNSKCYESAMKVREQAKKMFNL